MSFAIRERQPECPGPLLPRQSPEHRHEQIDREQPDQDHLPEAQVARGPVLGRHFRIAVEQPFSNPKNIDTAREHEHEAKAENDSQREYRIMVRVDDRQGREAHCGKWLVETYQISIANGQPIVEFFRAQMAISEVPIGRKLLIELYREGDYSHYFFHSLIGRSANDALSRIVAWRVRERIGGNALVTIDDYGFLLILRRFQELPLAQWRGCFRRAEAEEDLHAALRGSELVKWPFRGVAQTGLMVPRHLPGRERKPRQLSWSSEVLFRVPEQHERDHPLLQEAYRQAMHTLLDAEPAYAFLVQVKDFGWKLRELPVVSPFSFPIYASKIKESMMLEDRATAIERIYFEMYSCVEQVAAENPKGRAR